VVSAHESEWSVLPSTELRGAYEGEEMGEHPRAAAWPECEDDAALARALHEQEWGGRPRGVSAARAPGPCGLPREQHGEALPAAVLHTLRENLSTCVVCMEALATVVWEPCGHLALCQVCFSQLKGDLRSRCVVCRTPGAPNHLLRNAKGEALGGPLWNDQYGYDGGLL
jgi:hypothetical protein